MEIINPLVNHLRFRNCLLDMKPRDVVLLGGRDSDGNPFNNQYKFLLRPDGNQDIFGRTLDVLDKSEHVGRVFFVGPVDLIRDRVLGRRKDYVLVPETDSFWGNLSSGIEKQQQLGGDQKVLLVCSDLPFLTTRSVDWVSANCYSEEGLRVPIVSQGTLQTLSPIYETYYWPMREFPFKWADNTLLLDINTLNGDRMSSLVERYRDTRPDNSPLAPFERLGLLCEYGGKEAVFTLLLNYASKVLQMRFDSLGYVPFSSIRSRRDYERLITQISGVRTELVEMPYVDTVLDVDNCHRFGIFQRGYDEISSRVASINP